MKIEVEFNEKQLSVSKALKLVHLSIGYKTPDVSVDMAFPEKGKVRITEIDNKFTVSDITPWGK